MTPDPIQPGGADGLIDELGRPVDVPDLTESIMGQLGYARSTTAQRSRLRRLRACSRIAFVFATGAVIGVALHATRHGESARVPEAQTLPGAVQENLRDLSDHVDGTIRIFRTSDWAAPAGPDVPRPPTPPASRFEEDVDRSAIAAVHWI